MHVNDFFEKVFCLNLDRRTDRWEECEKQFQDLNLKVERFTAVDGRTIENPPHGITKGRAGWMYSVINLLEKSKKENIKNFLMIEDDIEFYYKFNEMAGDFLCQIPKDWDVFYFSGNYVGGGNIFHVKDNIYRCFGVLATHIVAFNESSYDTILEELKLFRNIAGDNAIAATSSKLNMYMSRPFIAWQREGYSDIDECSSGFYNWLTDKEIYEDHLRWKNA